VPVDGLASVLVTEYHEGTKPALFVVRAFHGARRPHACRCRFFRMVVKEVRSFIKGKEREGKYNALPLRVSI
jgi:3-deoxy-D-arabino-heptulosonate 7-phosphate (DAHP) synthase class II